MMYILVIFHQLLRTRYLIRHLVPNNNLVLGTSGTHTKKLQERRILLRIGDQIKMDFTIGEGKQPAISNINVST